MCERVALGKRGTDSKRGVSSTPLPEFANSHKAAQLLDIREKLPSEVLVRR